MKGTFNDLSKVEKSIIKHQQLFKNVHQLTCGEDSKHQRLTTRLEEINEFTGEWELTLVCPTCNYTQEIPSFFTEPIVLNLENL